MTRLADVYRPSLALLTDLYELTMAQAYWKSGTAEKEAVFHLYFRRHPFEGGFTIACGLARALDHLAHFRVGAEDLAYLGSLTGNDARPLFDPAFLTELGRLELGCDVDAVPEGTVVFPQEPLLRVKGPILQAQILETVLLNAINFETLIATKAARICLATRGEPVIEFGLRRAQGIDGGLSASRAAYIGGCVATSNVLAGRLYGIPVRGTHAHSWVMSFDSELESFLAYAEAQPNNCVFLVDTYDTIEGIRRAVVAGHRLRERGYEMVGIRLDSGDLAYLSIEARRLLDEAGFPKAQIVASNDLDEGVITSLKDQDAAINVWGVGTRLVTGGNQSALGGVYKLAAVRGPGGPWKHRVKVSEQAVKVSNPGIQQVRRYEGPEGFLADVIWDEDMGFGAEEVMIDPLDPTRRRRLPVNATSADLLIPVVRSGRIVYEPPPVTAARERVRQQLSRLHAGVKRFVNPHQYPVGLTAALFDLRSRLILEARGLSV